LLASAAAAQLAFPLSPSPVENLFQSLKSFSNGNDLQACGNAELD